MKCPVCHSDIFVNRRGLYPEHLCEGERCPASGHTPNEVRAKIDVELDRLKGMSK